MVAVLGEQSRGNAIPQGVNLHTIEELMSGGTPQRRGVLEDVETAGTHQPTAGGAVDLPDQPLERLPEHREVFSGEPGLPGEVGIDEARAAEESVGDIVLAADRPGN